MTDLLAVLLSLASPEGVVLLVITLAGIGLFAFVGLGGVGPRDLLQALSVILTPVPDVFLTFSLHA